MIVMVATFDDHSRPWWGCRNPRRRDSSTVYALWAWCIRSGQPIAVRFQDTSPSRGYGVVPKSAAHHGCPGPEAKPLGIARSAPTKCQEPRSYGHRAHWSLQGSPRARNGYRPGMPAPVPRSTIGLDAPACWTGQLEAADPPEFLEGLALRPCAVQRFSCSRPGGI